MRKIVFTLVLGIALVGKVLPAYAHEEEQFDGRQVVAKELLVKVKPGSSDAVHRSVGARMKRTFAHTGWQQVTLPDHVTLRDGIGRYKKQVQVLAVEPNYLYQTYSTPNDSYLWQLWGLSKIQAQPAWDTSVGDSNLVVAVLDSGINYHHVDLRANMWRNPGEVPGNGLDDDGNGYVDDIYGFDAVNDDSDPMDDVGHGSHVAGTIGAVGNNGTGVVGVNWRVKLMALKFINEDKLGSTADAIEAYNYLLTMKQRGVNVRVANNSWGGPWYSQALKDAIDAAGRAGIVSIAAAGNEYRSNDITPSYQASFSSPSVIAVAASDQNDLRAAFSNYGTSVHLAAPGVDIVSTYYTGVSDYATSSGTSMAAPHVAGAAALLFAGNPSLSVADVKTALLSTVDKMPQWSGVVASGGRLNLSRAMQSIAGDTTPAPQPVPRVYRPDLQIRSGAAGAYVGDNIYGSGQTVTGQATAGTAAIYQVRIQNDGDADDSFTLTGSPAVPGWTVRYFDAMFGGSEITGWVNSTGWRTTTLSPGSATVIRVEVTPAATLATGAQRQVAVSAKSTTEAANTDTVLATTSALAVVRTAPITSLSVTASPVSPQPLGTAITLTATADGEPVEYLFQVGMQVSRHSRFGGRIQNSTRYTTIQQYGTATSTLWKPRVAGTYSIRVYARRVGDRGAYEKMAIIEYVVSPRAMSTIR